MGLNISRYPHLAQMWVIMSTRSWIRETRGEGRKDLGPLLKEAAHCLLLCPLQVPSQQGPLTSPGLSGGALTPDHAQCCPWGVLPPVRTLTKRNFSPSCFLICCPDTRTFRLEKIRYTTSYLLIFLLIVDGFGFCPSGAIPQPVLP